MFVESEMQFDRKRDSEFVYCSNFFINENFLLPLSELFKALLAQSRDGFHQMFKQTYGVIYEQNSYVFSELFVKLEGYFLRGKLDLTDMMDKFFNQLYQKMFTVINSHYHFNDE